MPIAEQQPAGKANKPPILLAQTLLVLVTLVWGSTFPLVKSALLYVSPLLFNLLRMSLATLVLVAVNHRQLRSLSRADIRLGALTGGLLALGYQLQTAGLARTTPTRSAFLTGLVVVLVPLLSAIPGVARRSIACPGRETFAGALLAFAGILLLTRPAPSPSAQTATGFGLGELLSLLCAVAFAAHLLAVDRAARTLRARRLGTLQIAFCALTMLVTLPLGGRPHLHLAASVLTALAVTALLATATAFTLQSWAQQHLPPTHTALLFTLEPVFAALTAIVFLHEDLGHTALLGAALILAGILFAELRPRRSCTPQHVEPLQWLEGCRTRICPSRTRSPALRAILRRLYAVTGEGDAMTTTTLDTILHAAAIAPLDIARLRITGPDATRWLNGMVTNNIRDLAPGHGNVNLLLNAQGRILGTATIYREPGLGEASYLLHTDAAQRDAIRDLLDRYIIMDDVELTPFDTSAGSLLLGPDAPKHLEAIRYPALEPLRLTTLPDGVTTIATPTASLVPEYHLFATETLPTLELPQIAPEALEGYRILTGTPRYGIDIRNTDTAKDLPQETGQTHALSFNKGCYVGQEIVERIHARGQVHRQFTAFTLQPDTPGDLPFTLPTPLTADGRPAGELTSIATLGDTVYALGYARREALQTHTPLRWSAGAAVPRTASHPE